jgi:hypothetical protein
MNVFTSDVFLETFAPVIRGAPFLGHQMWVVRRGPVKMAYCSPWNGFIDDSNWKERIVRGPKS